MSYTDEEFYTHQIEMQRSNDLLSGSRFGRGERTHLNNNKIKKNVSAIAEYLQDAPGVFLSKIKNKSDNVSRGILNLKNAIVETNKKAKR